MNDLDFTYVELQKGSKTVYVKVGFPDGRSYWYLSNFALQVGDKVFVEGTKATEEGIVEEVRGNSPQKGITNHILNVVDALGKSAEVLTNNSRIEISEEEAKGVWLTAKDALGNYHITRYKGKEREVLIPGKIGKKEISMIGLYASVNDMITNMDQKDAIEKVIISDGIKYIAKYAFAGLKNLKEVVIPDSVTYISPLAFVGCTQYKSPVRSGYSYASEIVDYIGHYDGNIFKNSSFSVVRNEEYNIHEEHHSLQTETLSYLLSTIDGRLQPKPNSATKYVIVEDDLYTNAVKFKDFMALKKAGKCKDTRAIFASELFEHIGY